MAFAYSLDPSSKKFICPNCQKKRFVRLIDSERNYLEAKFGRCDRSNSCGYKSFPASANNEFNNGLVTVPMLNQRQLLPSIIDPSVLEKTLKKYEVNSLFIFLTTKFEINEILHVFKLYKIGTANKWGGSTIFWQIDSSGNIRSGKIIKYDSLTGKRIKRPFPKITWAHTLLKIKQFNLQQVLFGEHLLVTEKDKTVCLVESEKTAVIMAIVQPNYLWLAVGSLTQFNAQRLKILKDRMIVVYPDSDGFSRWNEKAKSISIQINTDIFVSQLILNETIGLNQSEGFDLADLI